MQTPPPLTSFLAFRYWPTWAGMFLLMILAWMPFLVRLKTGELLGLLTYRFSRERRYITSVNIAMCFPELDNKQQQKLVRDIFLENGIGMIETVTSWVRKPGSFKNRTTLTGLDNVEAAKAKGKGVLLIGAHFSTLDLGANLISWTLPLATVYRPHRNPLFNAFILRGRLSNCTQVFDRNDIRGILRHLKQGDTLWYAPDQDYGPEHAVYAPFFGQRAATITACSRFAAFNESPVFFLRHHRVGRTNNYEMEFVPFPGDYPSDDDVQDATLLNSMIEKAIRHYPAQYMWMHKRFKTQPGGKPDSPYIDIRTPNRKLTEEQYAQLMATAELVSTRDGIDICKLENGQLLRQYPGMIGKSRFQSHPGHDFDRLARELRIQGFNAVTIDTIFRIPALGKSVVTYFVPNGKSLGEIPASQLPLKALAGFIASLHEHGFYCPDPKPDQFIIDQENFAIADPGVFEYRHSPASREQRSSAMKHLADNLGLGKQDRETFIDCYTEAAGLEMPAGVNG